jgi:threonine/homoserine/homoserine lactone efflux protein
MFVGRVGVTLGIINGGLGLQVAEAETRWIIAYSVVAGVLWLVWMGVAMWSEIRRLNRLDEEAKLRRLREAEEEKPPAYA